MSRRKNRKSLFGGDAPKVDPDMIREHEKKQIEKNAKEAVGNSENPDSENKENAAPADNTNLDRDTLLAEYKDKVQKLNDLLTQTAEQKTEFNIKKNLRTEVQAKIQNEKSRLENKLSTTTAEQMAGFLKELQDVQNALGSIVVDIKQLNKEELQNYTVGLSMIGDGLSRIFNTYGSAERGAAAPELEITQPNPKVEAKLVDTSAAEKMDAVQLATEIKNIDTQLASANTDAEQIATKLGQIITWLDRTNVEKELQSLQKEFERKEKAALKSIANNAIKDVADNLERSAEFLPKQKEHLGAIFDSVAERLKKADIELQDAFKKYGIEKVETNIGDKPDYDIHAEVAKVPVPNKNTGEIISVQESGYYLNGLLLRPSKVVVAA